MSRLNQFVQLKSSTSDSVKVGDLIVTPESQALEIRFPFGAFIWNRPIAVTLDDGENMERIPIVDVTRLAQIGIIGVGVVLSLSLIVFSKRQKV